MNVLISVTQTITDMSYFLLRYFFFQVKFEWHSVILYILFYVSNVKQSYSFLKIGNLKRTPWVFYTVCDETLIFVGKGVNFAKSVWE